MGRPRKKGSASEPRLHALRWTRLGISRIGRGREPRRTRASASARCVAWSRDGTRREGRERRARRSDNERWRRRPDDSSVAGVCPRNEITASPSLSVSAPSSRAGGGADAPPPPCCQCARAAPPTARRVAVVAAPPTARRVAAMGSSAASSAARCSSCSSSSSARSRSSSSRSSTRRREVVVNRYVTLRECAVAVPLPGIAPWSHAPQLGAGRRVRPSPRVPRVRRLLYVRGQDAHSDDEEDDDDASDRTGRLPQCASPSKRRTVVVVARRVPRRVRRM